MDNGVELKVSDGKGEGIFARKAFKISEIVILGRIEKKLRKNHSHASQIGENEYVFHGGLVSKVNHCCTPNCGIRVNETGAHDFVATKEIAINEEITFDYAMRNYGVEFFPKQCLCGSDLCRGTITGWKDLPDARKKAYKGFVAPYLLEMEASSLGRSLTQGLKALSSYTGAASDRGQSTF